MLFDYLNYYENNIQENVNFQKILIPNKNSKTNNLTN